MTNPKTLSLWKMNRVTGYWEFQRKVIETEAQAWLRIFREDEPDTLFVATARKPRTT